MKHRAIVVRECQTKAARARRLKKGTKLFPDTGEWVLRTIAEMTDRCTAKAKKPCMHVETLMLTEEEIESINRTDWHTDMEELIADVERGKRGSA